MIENYLKIAWRNLIKNKLYSAIKVGGFAFSIAACMLIALFIHYELSYDQSYPNGERIYRIIGQSMQNGTLKKGTSFPAPLASAIKEDFPEVENTGRIMPNPLFYGAGSNQVTAGEDQESAYEQGFTYIDQDLLDMLDVPMIYGERAHALDAPNTVVMSKTKAQKFFPDQNPVNKIIYLNNNKNKPYVITGVMDDFPSNSHLHGYDFLLTFVGNEFYPGEQTNWGASNYVSYVQVKPETNILEFQQKLTEGILNKYIIPSMIEAGDVNANKIIGSASLLLQPLADIYLNSYDIDDKSSQRGDIRFVWLFGGIAIFILLIACINFINLSTAKSANRAKEVGLRKVVGSNRGGLIAQFLIESTLYSLLSVVLGLLIAWIMLPFFNELTGKSLIYPWTEVWLLPAIAGLVIFIGLLSGLYPSFYLSAFKPMSVLKGQVSQGGKNPILRSGLVVFQFTTSIILIIGTLIVYNQMQFVLNKKLGFDKEQVMLIQGTQTLGDQVKTFKDELLKIPQVESVSISDFLPVRAEGVKRNGNPFWNQGRMKQDAAAEGQFWEIDEDYLQTMGMHLVAGRNFSKDRATDSASVLINETLAKELNLSDPIGARITNGREFTVIGVVEDFNIKSLKYDMIGVCMALGTSPSITSVKLNAGDMQAAITSVSSLWKKFSPHQAIRYTFLDESYSMMYADVQRMGYVFTCFSVLAVIVACLGLFGLAAFSTEQRIKEIGVRKVLGASVNSILQLLSKDFIKLIVIAFIIAAPIAWWAMSKWLEDFAYRIEMEWWVFALTFVLALSIALLTVSFQAIKAAISNPVDSLRDE